MKAAGFVVALLVGMLALAQGYAPPAPRSSALSAEAVLAIVADAGTLAQANKDLYANALVLSSLTADGGVATYAAISNQDARWKLGPGTQMEMVPNGNSLSFNVGDVRLPTTYMQQPANPVGTTVRWFTETAGTWFGVFPSSDVTGCAAGTEGGMKANSSTHRFTYCDGTTAQEVPYQKVWSAPLDFAVFSGVGCQNLTFTATGSARGQSVAVGGCDDISGADVDLACSGSVDGTNATIQVCCLDGAGCANPPSITFTVTALR